MNSLTRIPLLNSTQQTGKLGPVREEEEQGCQKEPAAGTMRRLLGVYVSATCIKKPIDHIRAIIRKRPLITEQTNGQTDATNSIISLLRGR